MFMADPVLAVATVLESRWHVLIMPVTYQRRHDVGNGQILRRQPDWNLFRDGAPGGESPAQVAARAVRRQIRQVADGAVPRAPSKAITETDRAADPVETARTILENAPLPTSAVR